MADGSDVCWVESFQSRNARARCARSGLAKFRHVCYPCNNRQERELGVASDWARERNERTATVWLEPISMKRLLQIGALALMLNGCASNPASQNIISVYTDGSPSPVTREQACNIAKREAKARDNFLDEPRIRHKPSQLIIVTANRINEGGWRAIARSSVSENGADGGGGAAFLNVPAAVVTIAANGKVIDYARYTNDQIYQAQQDSGGDGGKRR